MPGYDHLFAREEVFPSWFVNAIQAQLSTYVSGNFIVQVLSGSSIRVDAGSGDGLVAIGVQGRFRYVESTVTRAHPGGSPGTWDIFVTASDNNVTSSPLPNSDHTDYTFALAIVAHSTTPGGVALYRKVGELQWSGSAITAITMMVGPAAITPAQIGAAAATDLTTEATARAAADTTLTTSIATETSARTAADTSLNTTLSAAITTEAATRAAADSAETASRIAGDANNPSASEKAAFVGTAGTPGAGNPFVTTTDSRLWNTGDIRMTGCLVVPSGWELIDGIPRNRARFAALFDAITVQQSVTTVASSATMTVTDSSKIQPGWVVEGPGVPGGATVATIVNPTTITLSAAATSSNRAVTARFCPYGNGDGSTTFDLPPFAGRVPIGAGTGVGLTARTVGGKVGAETHAHTANAPSHTHSGNAPFHTHTGNAPDHTHGISLGVSINAPANRGTGSSPTSGTGEGTAYTNHLHSGSVTGGTGGASATAFTTDGPSATAFVTGGPSATGFTTDVGSGIQPSLGINFAIKS